MDRDLRDLERAANSGDTDAAYALYRHRSRFEEPREATQGGEPRDRIEFEQHNFEGPLQVIVFSETEIGVYPAQEPNQYGGLATIPVYANRVPYRIYGRLHYYSDAYPWNWIPYEPETVEEARQDFEQHIQGHSWWNKWQDALSSTDSSIQNIRRTDGPGEATPAGIKLIREVLSRAISTWADQNQDMIKTAGLLDINNKIIKAENELFNIEDHAHMLRQKLGSLYINELHLRD